MITTHDNSTASDSPRSYHAIMTQLGQRLAGALDTRLQKIAETFMLFLQITEPQSLQVYHQPETGSPAGGLGSFGVTGRMGR
jgi:hypothetical protein